jgi:hypothetical protein
MRGIGLRGPETAHRRKAHGRRPFCDLMNGRISTAEKAFNHQPGEAPTVAPRTHILKDTWISLDRMNGLCLIHLSHEHNRSPI